MVAGPWGEIRRTAKLDPLGAELIYETVDAVRRFDNYQPPEGFDLWDQSAIEEVAHEFIVEGEKPASPGSGRISRLASKATDEASFERLMETAVRNHFRMGARRTDSGAALRALTHAVDHDDAIVVAGNDTTTRTWALSEFAAADPYAGEVTPLVDAAHAVTGVRRARWSSASLRRAPLAESESLRRVIHAILDAAAAPVSPRLVLDVILARFPLALRGSTVEFDDAQQAGSKQSPSADIIAAEIWDQLSDNERLVLAVLGETIRAIEAVTGLPRSTAHRSVASAKLVLAECLADLDEQNAVIAALRQRSADAQKGGTQWPDSAFRQNEED